MSENLNVSPRESNLSERTAAAAGSVLAGKSKARALLFAGPAIISSIAYMDPGNFATNIQAGARFGYQLLWVAVLANAVAMLFQALSAKLGIATGRNLAEMCRERYSPRLVWLLWAISEIAAMATDLAEFVGSAIGISLLFQLPLMVGMAISAVITYGILCFEKAGFRPLEIVVGALIGVIGLCYLAELALSHIAWGTALRHMVLPALPNAAALTIAVGIVGATVMPHALFLHSGLVQRRLGALDDRQKKTLLRYSNIEVLIALGFAGMINLAMVMVAAAVFHPHHPEVAQIEEAYRTLTPLLGKAAATIFLISLIASGISSSVVGTMAGQMIMQGFIGRRIPIWLRRLVTMAPAFIVIGMGVDPTRALVWSQVMLSLALPVPMITLVLFTRDKKIMRDFTNSFPVHLAAMAGAVIVLLLNILLLLEIMGVALPGISAA